MPDTKTRPGYFHARPRELGADLIIFPGPHMRSLSAIDTGRWMQQFGFEKLAYVPAVRIDNPDGVKA